MPVAIDDITLAPPALDAQLDLRAVFNNDHPIELEIGCGKGAFLVRVAKAHPERNFLGIEWANQIYRYAADRMARWGLTNVRVMRTDAKFFVERQMPDASIAALHIYHPDPWPKKRHQKRRLIQPDFAEAAIRVLVPGGRWAIQTDHADYFEQIERVTTACTALEPVPFDDPDHGTADDRVETNYEIKYVREGREIYRLAFRKRL